jgi:hypothetical protein
MDEDTIVGYESEGEEGLYAEDFGTPREEAGEYLEEAEGPGILDLDTELEDGLALYSSEGEGEEMEEMEEDGDDEFPPEENNAPAQAPKGNAAPPAASGGWASTTASTASATHRPRNNLPPATTVKTRNSATINTRTHESQARHTLPRAAAPGIQVRGTAGDVSRTLNGGETANLPYLNPADAKELQTLVAALAQFYSSRDLV